MAISYPKPHPPSPAPANTAVHKLVHTPPNDLVQAAELHFHKSLKHDDDGRVIPSSFKSFLAALNEHRPADFQNIESAGLRPLVNPQAGLAADRLTLAGWHFRIPKPPEQDGKHETAAAEMIELYWMALLRDVNFLDYPSNALAQAAASELSALKLYAHPDSSNHPNYTARPVTPATLFRGGEWTPAGQTNQEHLGPLVSQFLWLDVPYGSLRIKQTEGRVVNTDYQSGGVPHMIAWADWLDVQRGKAFPSSIELPATPRYIQNAGDIARYVHLDALYEAYLNAALILLGSPGVKLDAGNPYNRDAPVFPHEEGFGTFGSPFILSLVCEVATCALKAVWYQKFIGNLRLRPEAYGGLVHRALHPTGLKAAEAQLALSNGLAVLQASNASGGAVARIRQANAAHGANSDSYLLPMCFADGSPAHGSYGAGHATVAGACVTALKAYFAGTQKLKDVGITPVIPTSQGTDLTTVGVPDADQLTIAGELDKVASNIAIGRNMAGVHWRTDYSASMLLGQRIATSVLYHLRRDYHERPWKFSYLSFGKKVVEIEQDRVTYDGALVLDGDDDLDPALEAAKLSAIV
ncbi:vanadium-dependent haloperoxidase [Bradyrhizobium sp. C-145]|uniref:vanadium-dependent haloperoxidase n=1 Tax=Bradyrhizobium sp. C-145 TaxID=574727 RepID=UPI00201B5497|nr:vanadium-dependent haloperoxidase [Bradyrhizobium sp. C-145]UQR67107.1 vanadium-dependent haloperoxidase [Bradyrhizobium sp. C-145]